MKSSTDPTIGTAPFLLLCFWQGLLELFFPRCYIWYSTRFKVNTTMIFIMTKYFYFQEKLSDKVLLLYILIASVVSAMSLVIVIYFWEYYISISALTSFFAAWQFISVVYFARLAKCMTVILLLFVLIYMQQNSRINSMIVKEFISIGTWRYKFCNIFSSCSCKQWSTYRVKSFKYQRWKFILCSIFYNNCICNHIERYCSDNAPGFIYLVIADFQ